MRKEDTMLPSASASTSTCDAQQHASYLNENASTCGNKLHQVLDSPHHDWVVL